MKESGLKYFLVCDAKESKFFNIDCPSVSVMELLELQMNYFHFKATPLSNTDFFRTYNNVYIYDPKIPLKLYIAIFGLHIIYISRF